MSQRKAEAGRDYMHDLSRSVICCHVHVTCGCVTRSLFAAAAPSQLLHSPRRRWSPANGRFESGWRGWRCWRIASWVSPSIAFPPHVTRFDGSYLPQRTDRCGLHQYAPSITSLGAYSHAGCSGASSQRDAVLSLAPNQSSCRSLRSINYARPCLL